MSHSTEDFLTKPSILTFNNMFNNKVDDKINFIVQGQGVFVFENPKRKSLVIKLHTNKKNRKIAFLLSKKKSVILIKDKSCSKKFKEIPLLLEKEAEARYWLSLDSLRKTIKLGFGESREKCTQIKKEFDLKWLEDISYITVSQGVNPVEIYRDPIVIEPPLKVIPSSKITIEDVARNNYTVPANLSLTCQKLYNNIAGENFKLNTSDFPDFTEAIEYSIKTPGLWCYEKLKSKSSEFGKDNPKETYLRITLGQNQGDSPGVPYVIEIWPPDHCSPIHNHGDTHAIIRVLHGEINVELYPMLSKYHEIPFLDGNFSKDDVTWITPRLNQIHKLHNKNIGGPTCITIQCYMYGDLNTAHYKYFDFLEENGKIGQFDPNSDAEFLEFKEIIKKEWTNK